MESLELAVKEIATIRLACQNMKKNESALWYQIKGSCIKKFTSSVIEQAIAQFEMEKEEWI